MNHIAVMAVTQETFFGLPGKAESNVHETEAMLEEFECPSRSSTLLSDGYTVITF
ncbi:hypothetical protein GCM10023405_16630 [Streptomonospora salina]